MDFHASFSFQAKVIVPEKCKIYYRFFFDHVGAKRKASFAPRNGKKKAPIKNFAVCGRRRGLLVLDRAAF